MTSKGPVTDLEIDAEVVVDDPVAQAHDAAPLDLGMPGGKSRGQSPGGFPDDLQIANDRVHRPIIPQERVVIEPGQEPLDLLDRFPDVVEQEPDRSTRHR
jgi:hypothetical protein